MFKKKQAPGGGDLDFYKTQAPEAKRLGEIPLTGCALRGLKSCNNMKFTWVIRIETAAVTSANYSRHQLSPPQSVLSGHHKCLW